MAKFSWLVSEGQKVLGAILNSLDQLSELSQSLCYYESTENVILSTIDNSNSSINITKHAAAHD